MINPVTPWSATVQSDIENSLPLAGFDWAGYRYRFYNAGDSIWLVSQWPEIGQMAFRLAFGMNSEFDKVTVNEIDGGFLITATTRLGNYRITVTFYKNQPAFFRYTTTFRAAFSMLIPFWPRDIVPLTSDGRIENTAGKIHAHQEGGRSGLLYFSYTRPKTGSVFYFQNLTAMSEYCQASETILTNRVGGQWPEIGFEFPVNKDKPLPAGIEYVISDAFVQLTDEVPEKDFDITRMFLDYLTSVYLLLPRPETEYHNWPDIAEKALTNLSDNKGCWSQIEGKPYLNAYLGDYKTPAEIMVQLAVLLPLQEYVEWRGEKPPLWDDLNSGLDTFYDDTVKSIVRWHPARKDDLDKSEEQKQEMVMDSWYLHHPLLNLSRLALKGDKAAEKLFLDSIDFAIKVAHHFDYEWPVFYRMTTLEVLKAETQPGKGGEMDVPGSYAHIMLMAWQLTGEKRYLGEAAKAVKKLCGLAFDIFYQANNTAFTAAALVELYKETGDDEYLQISYCCLAGILRNAQLWDCNYGYGKHFPNFFAVFPLSDAPYTAAYEELEVYAALTHYLKVTEGIDILPSLQILLPEFIRYALGRLAYYYPPMLPAEMISEEVKTGEVQNDLWIPLEDIQDGWQPSGTVGQEVYGAGLPFGIVARQYYKVPDSDILIFTEYPASGFRKSKKTLTFHLAGRATMSCAIRIIGKAVSHCTMEQKTKSAYQKVTAKHGAFTVCGGSSIRISWR